MLATNWWQLDDYSGVLEINWQLLALELHCRVLKGNTVAWWTDGLGRWLGPAVVGCA